MKTVKGDLIKLALNGTFDVIIHGCNCFNIMGAGIAKQIAETFVGPYSPASVDKSTNVGDESKLGCFTFGYHKRKDSSILIIINAYTQYGCATKDNPRVVDYDAVKSAFSGIYDIIKNVPYLKIGYPVIGAGLAGGNWSIISEIIDYELGSLNHTLVEWDHIN
jgi:O-acetyl-ADP-ribose deacetylase (regulator of RNase III)